MQAPFGIKDFFARHTIFILALFVVSLFIIFLFLVTRTLRTNTATQPGSQTLSPTIQSGGTIVPVSPTPTFTPDQILQTEADEKYGKWQEEVITNYPWYNELPLQTGDYFVYFDVDQKKFISQLYPKSTNPTPINQQVENMKQRIMSELQAKKITTSNYEFVWNVSVE